jgi:hypothetical protein
MIFSGSRSDCNAGRKISRASIEIDEDSDQSGSCASGGTYILQVFYHETMGLAAHPCHCNNGNRQDGGSFIFPKDELTRIPFFSLALLDVRPRNMLYYNK